MAPAGAARNGVIAKPREPMAANSRAPLAPTGDPWLSQEDALTMLVRDLAVQLEDMAGQLDEQVRVQSLRMHDLAAHINGAQRHRGELADSLARLSARCDADTSRLGELDQKLSSSLVETRLDGVIAQVARLENSIVCSAEWQARQIDALSAKQVKQEEGDQAVLRRVAGLEDHRNEAEGFRDLLTCDLERHQVRLNHVEQSVREWADVQEKQGQFLDAQTATHEGHQTLVTERLNVIERNLGELTKSHGEHSEVRGHLGSLFDCHSLVRGQVEALQEQLTHLQANKIQSVVDDVASHEAEHAELAKGLHQRLKSSEDNHHDANQRLQRLEQSIQEHRGLHDHATRALSACEARLVGEAKAAAKQDADLELREHRGFVAREVEARVGSYLDTREVELRARLDEAMQEVLARHDKQTRSLELWSQSHERLTSLLGTCQEQCSATMERLNGIQRKVDGHDSAISGVHKAHGELARTLRGVNDRWDAAAELGGRVDKLQRRVNEQEEVAEVQAASQREMRLTMSTLDTSPTTSKTLPVAAAAEQQQELQEQIQGMRSEFRRLAGRVGDAERSVEDTVEKHRGELGAVHARLAAVADQLTEERSARDVQAHKLDAQARSRITDLASEAACMHAEPMTGLQEVRKTVAQHARDILDLRAENGRRSREVEEVIGQVAAKVTAQAAKVAQELRSPLVQRLELMELAVRDCRKTVTEEQTARRKEHEYLEMRLGTVARIQTPGPPLVAAPVPRALPQAAQPVMPVPHVHAVSSFAPPPLFNSTALPEPMGGSLRAPAWLPVGSPSAVTASNMQPWLLPQG